MWRDQNQEKNGSAPASSSGDLSESLFSGTMLDGTPDLVAISLLLELG